MSSAEITVGSRTIELSDTGKVLFTADGITKGDVVDCYRRAAGTILPPMKDRPLSMQRFPDGIEKRGFYEKKLPGYFPEWVESASVYLKEKKRRPSPPERAVARRTVEPVDTMPRQVVAGQIRFDRRPAIRSSLGPPLSPPKARAPAAAPTDTGRRPVNGCFQSLRPIISEADEAQNTLNHALSTAGEP